MTRMTVSLSDELALLVRREARRRDASASEAVRSALAAELGIGQVGPHALPIAALGHSGHRNTARNAERILAREWGRARRR
jgi:Arc/MetJ-type ribon-helix-helix transcriptional regulator